MLRFVPDSSKQSGYNVVSIALKAIKRSVIGENIVFECLVRVFLEDVVV